MIQIDKDTMQKLDRYAGKQALANKLCASGDEVAGLAVYDDEFRELQHQLVEEFLPLVQRLSAAGLLTASVDLTIKESTEMDSVSGDATTVFENGNIWVHADEVSGGTCRDETELAEALESYTNPNSPEYDPEFDRQIRKVRPDWFE